MSAAFILDEVRKDLLSERMSEIDYIKSLGKKQGWNIGRTDFYSFIKSGQVDFYCICLKDGEGNKSTIGAISVFSDGHFSMIGSFILTAERRGNGVGQFIFSEILEKYKGTHIGLLSDPKRQAFYERNGLSAVACFSSLAIRVKKPMVMGDKLDGLTAFEMENLLKFDSLLTGIHRHNFLRSLIDHSSDGTYVAFEDGVVSGYGLIRPLDSGWRVSIYGTSSQSFQLIFGKLINHFFSTEGKNEDETFFMDCPSDKERRLLPFFRCSLENRYPVMFSDNRAALPRNLGGEGTWGILSEECG